MATATLVPDFAHRSLHFATAAQTATRTSLDAAQTASSEMDKLEDVFRSLFCYVLSQHATHSQLIQKVVQVAQALAAASTAVNLSHAQSAAALNYSVLADASAQGVVSVAPKPVEPEE